MKGMAGSAHTTERPVNRSNSNYIPTLDGWRAVAVSLVIGAHAVPMLNNSQSPFAVIPAKIFAHAGYGVDIFFAMSGFLISTLLMKEKSSKGTIDIRRFYIRRFFRIIPPIILYILALLYLRYFDFLLGLTFKEVFASIVFMRNYFDGSWYTGHFWSLSIEEHFYLFAPFFILVFRPRKLMICYLTVIGLCIIVRYFELSHPGSFQPLPQFRTENRVDALLWGSVCALICHDVQSREIMRRILTIPTVVLLAALTASVSFLIDDQAFRRTIMGLVLPILISHTVLRPDTLWGRALEVRPVRLIGRMSYSIYIWQMLFLVPFDRPLGIVQGFPYAFVAIAIAASFSYWFVEKPMIRLGRRLSGERREKLHRVTSEKVKAPEPGTVAVSK